MPCIQLYTNPTLRDVCLKTMINLLQTSSIGANIVHRNIVSGPHLKIVEGIDKATHMWKWTPSPSSTIKRPRVWNAFEGFCRILLFYFLNSSMHFSTHLQSWHNFYGFFTLPKDHLQKKNFVGIVVFRHKREKKRWPGDQRDWNAHSTHPWYYTLKVNTSGAFRHTYLGAFHIRTLSSCMSIGARVAAPITDRLRDFVLELEKYKAVQNFPM